jgi:hypothetical protein
MERVGADSVSATRFPELNNRGKTNVRQLGFSWRGRTRKLKLTMAANVYSLAFSPDGRRIAAGSAEPVVRV